jgi:hypothetical protein
MFHILEKEMQWRREQGLPEGFDALRAHPPLVALGAEGPLDDQKMLADYFRKLLGLSSSLAPLLADFPKMGLTGWAEFMAA